MLMGDFGALTAGEVHSLSPSFPQPQVTTSHNNNHGSRSSQSPSQNGSTGTPVGTPGEGRPSRDNPNSLFYDAEAETLANGSVGSLDSGKCGKSSTGDVDPADELCSGVLGVGGVPGANYWSSLDCSSEQMSANLNGGCGGGLNGLNGTLSPQAMFHRRAITGGGGGQSSPNSLVGGLSSVCSNGTGSMAVGGSSSPQSSRLVTSSASSSSSNLFGAYSDWSTSSQHSVGAQQTAWSSGNGLAWPPQKRLLNSTAPSSSASAGGGLIKNPSQQAVGQPAGPGCGGPKSSLVSPSKFRRSTTLPMTKPGFQSFADFQDQQELRSHDIISFQVSSGYTSSFLATRTN